MNLVPFIMQPISGAVGGNIAGGLLKRLILGTTTRLPELLEVDLRVSC